jgi:hypothetical protein
MKIIGATREQIEAALEHVNKAFHDNIAFAGIEERQTRRDGRRVFLVTLKTLNSNEIGSGRRNGPNGLWRRLAKACWHAHGTFFDALPEGTDIVVGQGTVIHPGDKWVDSKIQNYPAILMASHACNCMEWNTSGVLPFEVNV